MGGTQIGKVARIVLRVRKLHERLCPILHGFLGPLERIRKLKKITPSDWGEQQQLAFKKIKNLIEKVPILSQPRWDLEFIVATDTLQFGVGAVLYQQVDEKNIHIKFASKSLVGGQKNYPAVKRELLAIMFALKRWRPILVGQ